MRALAVIAALLGSLLLTACGAAGGDSSNDFKGTKGEVAQVVEDLQKAAGDDDAGEICVNLLATDLLNALKAKSINCAKAVDAALDAVDSTELKTDSVQVTGATATAKVTSGSGDGSSAHTMRFARVGRNWKITSL